MLDDLNLSMASRTRMHHFLCARKVTSISLVVLQQVKSKRERLRCSEMPMLLHRPLDLTPTSEQYAWPMGPTRNKLIGTNNPRDTRQVFDQLIAEWTR